MSETVDSFPARRTKYNWPLWSDGRIHVLTRGVDFDVKPQCLAHAAYRRAEVHGIRVKTTVRGDRVWIQFYVKRGFLVGRARTG